jgi:predicted transposase YdaD
MSFDNLCKLLSEKYPARFAAWILGSSPASVKVLKTELSIEPIRADLESEPPLPLRMLDYWIRPHRLYRLPITQPVVLLLAPSEGTGIETVFALEPTRHEYRVIRLWEEDAALLPLASLAATSVPEQLLTQVAEQVGKIESTQQRQQVSAYTQLLAGLRFEKN